MDKLMASRPGWEMMSGFPSCTCSTKPEQLPDELAPGVPHACSHLYVKKSAEMDHFHVSLSPATSVSSREGSPVGGEAEKPQGVRVLRGRPVSIVIYPMPPRATNDMPRTAQSEPTFASLADERAADDLGVMLMGGVSRANSLASSRIRRIVRTGSGRPSPFRRSRSPLADGRSRKPFPGSVVLKMPSHAFEVDIKLEKVTEDSTAKYPNELAGRTDIVEFPEANGENGNKARCCKHTISSLVSSRIRGMNREARTLQESDCKRARERIGYNFHHCLREAKANAGSRVLYDAYSKHYKRQPRQFSFH